jgi:hypothetical protein
MRGVGNWLHDQCGGLFTEDQVILTEGWLENRIPIEGDWERISLFRLSDEDLLLSKLMRDDPHDFEDALFIVETRTWRAPDVKAIVKQARIPESSEIREEFTKALDRLLTHLENIEQILRKTDE